VKESSTTPILDILLRLKAGGIPSGGSFRFAVQSPDSHTFRARIVPQYRCAGLLAVPSRRYPYPRPLRVPVLFVPRGRRQASPESGVSSCSLSSSRHRHTLRGCVFTACPSGYCLVVGADRPPPEDGSESAPFRPIPALQYGGLSLKHPRGKLRAAVRTWTASGSDGAYPRPEGRGIAPVPHITEAWNSPFRFSVPDQHVESVTDAVPS
jgi:hypothetical protein